MAVKGILLLTFTLFLFNEIRPIGRDTSRFRGMKSLRDEIRLRREKDGFDFICEADFIRASLGFHRALRDFMELYTDLCYNPFDKQEFDKGV